MIDKLNALLASYQVFSMNTKGFHWNIVGNQFFELHQVYRELYDDLEEVIDKIAEHIRTFDETPLHDFYSFCEKSHIEEVTNMSDSRAIALNIVKSIATLIDQLEDLTMDAQRNNEFATFSILSKQLAHERKRMWMWSSFKKMN